MEKSRRIISVLLVFAFSSMLSVNAAMLGIHSNLANFTAENFSAVKSNVEIGNPLSTNNLGWMIYTPTRSTVSLGFNSNQTFNSNNTMELTYTMESRTSSSDYVYSVIGQANFGTYKLPARTGEKAIAMVLMVYGDGEDCTIQPYVKIGSAATTPLSGINITWIGWKLVEFPVTATTEEITLSQINLNNKNNKTVNSKIYFANIGAKFECSTVVGYSFNTDPFTWTKSAINGGATAIKPVDSLIPYNGLNTLRVNYTMPKRTATSGWVGFVYAASGTTSMPVSTSKNAEGISLMIYGDGNSVNLAPTFKFDGTSKALSSVIIDWTGWKKVIFAIPEANQTAAVINFVSFQFTNNNDYVNDKAGNICFANLATKFVDETEALTEETGTVLGQSKTVFCDFDGTSSNWMKPDSIQWASSEVPVGSDNGYALKVTYHKTSNNTAAYYVLNSLEWETGGLPFISGSDNALESVGMMVYGQNDGVSLDVCLFDDNSVNSNQGSWYIYTMRAGYNGEVQTIDWTGWKYVRFYPKTTQSYPITGNVKLRYIAVTGVANTSDNPKTIYLDNFTAHYGNINNMVLKVSYSLENAAYNVNSASSFSGNGSDMGVWVKGDGSDNVLNLVGTKSDSTYAEEAISLSNDDWNYYVISKDIIATISNMSIKATSGEATGEFGNAYIANLGVINSNLSYKQSSASIDDKSGLTAGPLAVSGFYSEDVGNALFITTVKVSENGLSVLKSVSINKISDYKAGMLFNTNVEIPESGDFDVYSYLWEGQSLKPLVTPEQL